MVSLLRFFQTWCRDPKNKAIYDALIEYCKEKGVKIIQWKDYKHGSSMVLDNLYNGNLSGTNKFNGESLAQFATYHLPTSYYLLLACELGYTGFVEEDIKMNTYRIIYQGIEQEFFTYPDNILRKLHLNSIWSNQVQGIGRSRLLRNACEFIIVGGLIHPQALLLDIESKRLSPLSSGMAIPSNTESKDAGIIDDEIIHEIKTDLDNKIAEEVDGIFRFMEVQPETKAINSKLI